MLEALMTKHGATRKNLRNCKSYFFDKVDCGNFSFLDKFLFYPEPTFDGWQRLFDEEVEETVTDQNVKTLNNMFCGQLADYFFCIEDQDYYFKTTFGDVYDKDRKFPLRINQESQYRTIAITENAIFLQLVNRMSKWLKAKDSKEQGIARFNERYFESLLPVIDTAPFIAGSDIPRETSDGSAKPDITRAGLRTILKFSIEQPQTESGNERFEAARRLTEILMDYADDLADLRSLYAEAKRI
ncbi:hypothetical protein MDG893_16157 [Marinobacter algicola DG893]|uniref:Uncharacterized protein n=2 Tax=Marinobacter algicola TaxID=236100 RepID=A6F2P6_9GAMM|nr:hypothetical protein MDG893_16157 [Marinobacter algicola DG893]